MNLQSKLNKVITLKTILVLTIVFIVMMMFLKLVFEPYFSNHVNGNVYIESMIFYSHTKLYNLISVYGEFGRDLYIKSAVSVDIFIPLIYSLFYTAVVIFILKKLKFKDGIQNIVLVGGFILCASDWIENVFLIIIVKSFPTNMPTLSAVACFMTILKSGLTIAFMLLILLLLAILMIKTIVYKKSNKKYNHI